MRPLVLLQTSDWHVGSVLGSGGLGLPAELREIRRDEIDSAPERAVAAARSVEADAMLVPGDLWDAESAPPSSIHRLLDALASFARPVFVAPGNHDFAGAGGFYDPEVLRALGMRSWPENVIVFRQSEFRAVPFPGRDDVSVTGRAFLSPSIVEERLLARPLPRAGAGANVLLLHGSFESYRGADAPSGGKKTAPFSREELLAAGFTWAALGHHHHVDVASDDAGVPRAAYSGSPTGRGLDECGPRVFLKVTIDENATPSVETITADARVVRDLVLDVTGLEPSDIASRAFALFDAENATPRDFVRLTLTGSRSHGARPASALTSLSGRVAHLSVRDKTAVSTGLDALDHRTAEGRFVSDLLARRGAAPDAYARRVAELALALGRDALAGRPLVPADPEEP